MRVALYARYSSDLQNQRSAEDQFAALRLVVQARSWSEVAAFSDLGISGSNLPNRPGVQTLLREAERGAFDVVFTEALDRLSRTFRWRRSSRPRAPADRADEVLAGLA